MIQDFLNTVGIGDYAPDLLDDVHQADAWMRATVETWSAERGHAATAPPLVDADLPKLRALRDTVRKVVAGESIAADAGAVPASLEVSKTGEVRLEPNGSGWGWFASAIWAEILLSQRDGTWRRIKHCRNPRCAATFYDRSKNNSGVWHDVKTCGNAANLRASRARRRRDVTS
ncbi:peptide chain release factor 2 [Mycobacterium sp. 1423905.2]|nr:peptide chain release factor 2 [Mycobacterium sp. 1423905.2]